jgi:hypothetical protein
MTLINQSEFADPFKKNVMQMSSILKVQNHTLQHQ